MPNNNLRLRYVLFLGAAATTVSAVPLDRRQAEENSGSLNRAIEDAVHMDNDIREEQEEVESDDEDEDDSDDEEDDAARNDSRNRPPIRSTFSITLPSATTTPLVDTLPTTTAPADTLPTTTALADTLPTTTATTTTTLTALPVALPSETNTQNRGAAIAGGTIGGLLFLALIAFLLYRFRKARPAPITYPNEKHPYPYPAAPPSTLFGGGSSQRTATPSHAPTMPKPPSLVFINPPTHNVDAGTFYRPETASGHTTCTTGPLPPVYEEMRSPGIESSISQTEPYPEKAAARKLYASFGPPPEPPAGQVSRFSWTTRCSSVESEPRFREVNSWVSNQAGRDNVKEKLAQMGLKNEVPATPVECRFHPGAPVQFGAGHGRMESEDLDRQLQMNLRR